MFRVVSLLRLFSGNRYLVRRLESLFVRAETQGKSFGVVVDVGCGRAPYKKIISAKQYIGIDIEDRGGVPDVLIADINKGIPLPDGTADLVLCTEVIEHTKDARRTTSEFFRILRPGGTLLLVTPFVWPVNEAPNDYWRFTEFGMRELLQGAGFSSVIIKGSNGYIHTMFILSLLPQRFRSWYLRPIALLLNITGYLVYKIEQSREFPVLLQIAAKK